MPEAARVLSPGGIFLSYLPTVLQIHELQAALVEHEGLRGARLTLADAARIVLRNGLVVLGIDAPAAM